jgi:hypothetical protein
MGVQNNILDAIRLANAFLATPCSSYWNPNADLNVDGVVKVLDAPRSLEGTA